MFYICKKNDEGKYGVMDTDDGVVEYYPPKELLKIYSKFHVDIEGITKKSDGKYSIRVLKPTSFESEDEHCIDSNGTSVLDSDFYRTKYEKLSIEKILELASDPIRRLLHIAQRLTGKSFGFSDIVLLDGIDCIGLDTFRLAGDVTCSIFFNGEPCSTGITANGFGLDVMDEKGHIISEEHHFDSTFNDWEKNFINFKYKYLFNSQRI